MQPIVLIPCKFLVSLYVGYISTLWPPAGNGGTVGGPTPTPGGMCDVNGLLGRVLESKVMVESANDQGDTVENIVGVITGGGRQR